MKNNALVTVIIPYYNHKKYVTDAILSVLNQTYKNIELIVIDDGSNDGGHLIIEEHAIKYGFRFIRKENSGLCSTLNLGLNIAKGDYFCTLASDDIWLPHKVEEQINFMAFSTSHIAAVSGGCELISDSGKVLSGRQRQLYKAFSVYDFENIILDDYYVPALNILWKKSVLNEINGYPIDTKLEDYASLLKVTFLGYKVVTLNKVLGKYRLHGHNTSANSELIKDEKNKLISFYMKELRNQTIDNTLLAIEALNSSKYKVFFYHLLKRDVRVGVLIRKFFRSLLKKVLL